MMWQPTQLAMGSLSDNVELIEDPDVEWLSDTVRTPNFSPLTSGSRTTVHAGKKFLRAARNRATHTSSQWTETMVRLKYKKLALIKLEAAGWKQGETYDSAFQATYRKERDSVATPPLKSLVVEIKGGGFQMIESLIKETEDVRAAYLRGRTLRKYDADSLIHAADVLAEMDMRNPDAGELKVEGSVKYEFRWVKLSKADIRRGDRLFAVDVIDQEAEDIKEDIKSLAAEREEWKRKQAAFQTVPVRVECIRLLR